MESFEAAVIGLMEATFGVVLAVGPPPTTLPIPDVAVVIGSDEGPAEERPTKPILGNVFVDAAAAEKVLPDTLLFGSTAR